MAKKNTKRAPAKKRRYVARVPIEFPAAQDLEEVLEAGGISNIADEKEREAMAGRRVTIAAGKSCNKVPDYVLETGLACGWIRDLEADDDENGGAA